MQKLSACRNRFSPIQRFSSTRIRCITAIWPAGPPKLSAAILAQTRTASLNGIPCEVEPTMSPGTALIWFITGSELVRSARGAPAVAERGVQVLEHGDALREPLLILRMSPGDPRNQACDAGCLVAAEFRVL